MPIKIIKSPHKMQMISDSLRADGKTIGLVPTMGALHDGHLKLVDIALKHSDIVVVSIFVNPTQFGPGEDYSKYPNAFKSDCRKLEKAGVDFVFHPTVKDIYPDGFSTFIDVGAMGTILEGARRPGHFKGVGTVCAKLFNITKPHIAVFGQKDGQQLAVLQRLVRDMNFHLKIVKGPIVRTSTGVAMSSRHSYLSADGLDKAKVIYHSLKLAGKLIRDAETSARKIETKMRNLIDTVPGAEIDYIAFHSWNDLKSLKKLSGRVMISLVVKIEGIRLLDNIIVSV